MMAIEVEVGERWRHTFVDEETKRTCTRDFLVIGVDRVENLVERVWLSVPVEGSAGDACHYVDCVRWKHISEDKVVPRPITGAWPLTNCTRLP
jgi:hypothetical protein